MDNETVRRLLEYIYEGCPSKPLLEWFDSHHHILNEDWKDMLKDMRDISRQHPDDKEGYVP